MSNHSKVKPGKFLEIDPLPASPAEWGGAALPTPYSERGWGFLKISLVLLKLGDILLYHTFRNRELRKSYRLSIKAGKAGQHCVQPERGMRQ